MPTVKAMTFRAGGGHHESCHARRGYLEKDSRAIGRVCINIAEEERWDIEMDRTRTAYHLRGCVNYREFIISPAEDDDATVEQVRELAVRWARENFPNAEVAIVLHDDNKERLATGKEGIVHAHVVVNTVDLDTGRKVVIKDSAVRDLHNSAQRIAEDLGLSTLPLYEPGKRLVSEQQNQRTQAERRMEIRGIDAWKSQVRDMALQALDVAASTAEFKVALDAAGVDIELRRGRLYLTDRDNPDRACRADRLDKQLSAKNLADVFAERQGLTESREALVSKIKEELVAGDKIHAEMRAYEDRCSKVLEKYREVAIEHEGEHYSTFPSVRMPTPKTMAEIDRYRQISRAFHNAAEQIRNMYAYIPQSSSDGRGGWGDSHSSGSSDSHSHEHSHSSQSWAR